MAVRRGGSSGPGRWRLILLAFVAAGLAPGTFVRPHLEPAGEARLMAVPLPFHTPGSWPAGLSVEGSWELRSPDPFFGGYSAMMPLAGGRVRAFTDRGDRLEFALPRGAEPMALAAVIDGFPAIGPGVQDVESTTRDPASGTYWLGYENPRAIRRFEPAELRGKQHGRPREKVQGEPRLAVAYPPQMARWPVNGGAEAMVRLSDGRFLVLGEATQSALLFDGDPLENPPVERFAVRWPTDFRPTDAAQLPDGRVLILLRKLVKGFPPGFRTMLATGDPPDPARGGTWAPEPMAMLDDAIASDNYEALLVEPDSGERAGAVTIWILSDDNLASFQRTLLARLRWEP